MTVPVLRLPVIVLLLGASAAGAEETPTLHYEEVGAFQLDLFRAFVGEGRLRLLVQEEGRRVIEDCSADLTACSLSEVVNGLEPAGFVSLEGPVEPGEGAGLLAEPTLASELSWPDGRVSFLPLEDGKRVTWSETSTAGDGTMSRFDVVVEQSCCLPVPPGVAALSDRLWYITMRLEQVAGPRRAVETRSGHWDPEIGWFVTYANALDFGDDSEAGVQYTRYREVRRIEGF